MGVDIKIGGFKEGHQAQSLACARAPRGLERNVEDLRSGRHSTNTYFLLLKFLPKLISF